MSRSRRHTPIFGFAHVKDEKEDKRINHKRERSHVRDDIRRQALTSTDLDNLPAVDRHALSDPWLMAKQGKEYRVHAPDRDMRK